MVKFPLNTHENARRTLGRLIREFHAGKIEEGAYRALVYGMNALLAYFKLDAELDIEARLERIEDALEIRGKR